MGIWSADTHANFVYLPAQGQLWTEVFDGTGPRVRTYPDGSVRITVGNRQSTQTVLATIAAATDPGCAMTRASTTTDQPRFRLAHKIAAWYDAEAYFRRRAKSGRAFAMPIPGFGDVLFAAKPAHIREFLKIPVSAFTPPMPNPIEPVVGDGSIILLDGARHKNERARFLPALHGERIRRYTGLMARGRVGRDREMATREPRLTRATRRSRSRLQIIVQAVFGIDDRNLRDHYVTVVKAMMRDYVAPFMFFPALRRAPFGLGPWRRFSARRVELDALLSEQISHRRHTGADGYDDVLSVLMSDDDGAGRSDDEVRQQLRTLLVSGHETSATTLAWALFHVHADEKVRQKLLDELADNPTSGAAAEAALPRRRHRRDTADASDGVHRRASAHVPGDHMADRTGAGRRDRGGAARTARRSAGLAGPEAGSTPSAS